MAFNVFQKLTSSFVLENSLWYTAPPTQYLCLNHKLTGRMPYRIKFAVCSKFLCHRALNKINKHVELTLLLGILFQLMVFILVLGSGVSCCGSFTSTTGAGGGAGAERERGGAGGGGGPRGGGGGSIGAGGGGITGTKAARKHEREEYE